MTDKICGHVIGSAQERLTCTLPANHPGSHAKGSSTWPDDRGVTAQAYLRIPENVRDLVDAILKENGAAPGRAPHAEFHERPVGVRQQVYVVLWWPWESAQSTLLTDAGFKPTSPDLALAEVLAPPMPGPYSGDTRPVPPCALQLQIAESTRYPGKPSIRVVGASGTRSPSHEFREALISAGFQIGDRAELRLLQETPAEVVRCGCWPGDLKGPCTNLAKGPEGCGDEEHGRGGQHQHVCTGCDNCNDAPARKEYTRAEEEAWARTLQDAGVVTRNTQDDLHSRGCVSPENHDGPCPTGGFVKPTEPAQLSVWDNLELAGYNQTDKEKA